MLYVLKMLPSVTLSDAIIIHNLYGLVDVILLLFVIQFFLELKRRAIIQIGVFLVFFVFWYLSYFIFVELNSSSRSLSAVFDTVSELCIAVAAAYALLQLTKPGHKSPLWILVILSSIFFYNFCSFFVAAFIDSNFIKDIWFLNSILNILTMLGYSLGFWLAYRSRMKLSNE